MKILLIYPYPLFDRSQEEDIKAVPIGLYSVAAVLRENHYDVEVLNWYKIHKTPQQIIDVLIKKRPDIIGFSILNANRLAGLEISRIAKKINPDVKIVFGGVAATFLWKHFLTHFPEVDFVVIGEGEYSFLNLVRLIEKNNYKKLKNIKGIAFRKKNRAIKTATPELISDLDQLPIPAKYFTYQHVTSSRGCPGRCTFCASPKLWRHRIRFRSAEHFVTELEILNEKGVNFFFFSDDAFTIDKKRVIAICKQILTRGLKIVWVAISRADYVNEEILYWMRKAGCIQISYGVESGSEKIRDILGKNLKTDAVKRAFALTHRYGILPRAYFIYGCPGETRETIEDTIRLIKEIKPLICIFYILEIYPGTALYSEYQKRFNATDDVWLKEIESICYFETDANLSQDLVFSFGRKLREEFFANIGHFADALDLIDKKELYPMHADSYSRLAMTFSHGDYARIQAIKEKEKIAERLFEKALSYFPDHRAYLGLGILRQNQRDFAGAVKILSEGIEHFPDSEQLSTCLAVNYMNLKQYRKALTYLSRFQDSAQASYYIAECYKALGDHKSEFL